MACCCSTNDGFDGVILSWARYIDEMREFQNDTYPMMVPGGAALTWRTECH